jgi:uncharacterized protein YbjT (DUF2867 family)
MNHPMSTDNDLYLITGATGNIGGYIVKELLRREHRVRALTRNPSKAEFPAEVDVITGDLSQPETVAKAFDGVTGVHFVTIGGDDFGPLESAPELVKMSEQAGVKRATVIWNGVPGPVENAVKASSLKWTILQPQEFSSNALEWIESIRSENVAREAFGDRKTAYIHPADIASVAAEALTTDKYHGEELVMTGPEVLTPKRAVQIISDVIGRPVRFEERSEEEERRRMKEELGLEQEVIDYVISWTKNPPKEGYTVSPVVEEVTGRPACTFREWVEEYRDLFNENETKNAEEPDMNNQQSYSEQITAEVISWPGVEAGPGKRGEFAFTVGRHEIGHLHGDKLVHFFFPREIGVRLREEGRVGPQPVAPESAKLASRQIQNDEDVLDVIELMKLNYDRIIRKHGLPEVT